MLHNFDPIYDATVMDKVYQADMIPVGKLNMDEFAMGGSTETSYFKKTKMLGIKPKFRWFFWWFSFCCRSRTSPSFFRSDTGGSIRQPAAFNGIIKPTYGRVSRFGLIAFASSLDQIGPLTRNVKDNALALNAISGYDEKTALLQAFLFLILRQI